MSEIILNSKENSLSDILENHIKELDISEESKLKQTLGFNDSQIFLKILGIKRGAFHEELNNIYKQYYRKKIQDGCFDNLISDLAEIREYINNENDKKKSSNYLWVTINPRSSVNIVMFKELVEKSLNKPWILNKCCVIEQRGSNEDEIGKGFHAHFIIDKGDYRFSHARREFISTFKKVCDTQNYHTFNFNYCFENDLKKRHKYILGQKADVEKHIKQEYDKKFRKLYDIPNYYGSPLIEKWD